MDTINLEGEYLDRLESGARSIARETTEKLRGPIQASLDRPGSLFMTAAISSRDKGYVATCVVQGLGEQGRLVSIGFLSGHHTFGLDVTMGQNSSRVGALDFNLVTTWSNASFHLVREEVDGQFETSVVSYEPGFDIRQLPSEMNGLNGNLQLAFGREHGYDFIRPVEYLLNSATNHQLYACLDDEVALGYVAQVDRDRIVTVHKRLPDGIDGDIRFQPTRQEYIATELRDAAASRIRKASGLVLASLIKERMRVVTI